MFRVYLGNLNKLANEQTIQDLFEGRGLPAQNITVKDGYAFVDCHDQAAVDKAIEQLNGYKLNGLAMQVEPALTRQRNDSPPGTRLAIRNVPQHVAPDTLREMLHLYGAVKDLDLSDSGGSVVMVTYAASDQAQQAKEKLDNIEFHGSRLKVEYVNRRADVRPSGSSSSNQKVPEFPLRLLIPYQFVGAIIGRSGQNIRSITQKTKARVDVIRHDSTLSTEKTVVILGAQSENCVEACVEILKVLTMETSSGTKREPELKILAHNNLCGRLIGRQGAVIRGMMEETKAIIAVSNISNVNHHSPDRVISIKGSMESVCTAIERVHGKLKAAFETDVKNVKYNPQMYYGGSTMMMLPSMGPTMPPHWYPRFHFAPWSPAHHAAPMPAPLDWSSVNGGGGGGAHITCYLYIPKASVGAIIGAKGSYINYLKLESRATCQVQEKPEEGSSSGAATSAERSVKITGHPEAVWKAQWHIFEKIRAEGFCGNEPAKLRCDMMVPKVSVGRIIGKGGQNVRQIQDISDAVIKLPDVQANGDDRTPSPQDGGVEEVAVQIVGNICAQTIAQSLIRQLLTGGPVMVQGLTTYNTLGGGCMGNGGRRSCPTTPAAITSVSANEPPQQTAASLAAVSEKVC